jgi:hypothetical protein
MNTCGGRRKSLGRISGRHRLCKRIAPNLIHALDAFYSALVIETVHRAGIKDIINVYDGWLVASDAEPVLREAIRSVGEPWLRGLGPFYAVFEKYLGDHPQYGPIVRGWRETWQRRVAAGNDWPVFLVKRETTFGVA